MYDQLFTKVNETESMIPSTTGFVNRSQYDTDKWNLEMKIEYVV